MANEEKTTEEQQADELVAKFQQNVINALKESGVEVDENMSTEEFMNFFDALAPESVPEEAALQIAGLLMELMMELTFIAPELLDELEQQFGNTEA